MRSPTTIALCSIFAGLLAAPALGGVEVMEIDPLADKDLYHFKQDGSKGWKIDDESDDIHTLVVHPRAKEDSDLIFVRRKFRQGFRLTMDVMGGSKNKGLEFYVVPPKGDWILLPISKRWLGKKGWRHLMITVEDGKAWAKVGDEKTERIDVPGNVDLSFAIRLLKRSEAAFRKIKIKFLVVSAAQMKPEEGFVRIFDGKTSEGWEVQPKEGKDVFKVGDQKIEGHHKEQGNTFSQFIFGDVVFGDYVLRFRASSDTRGLHLLAASNVHPKIDDYFERDKDWNEIEWEVKDGAVTLKVNGRRAWTQKLDQSVRANPRFLLEPRGGKCTLRDIRVKGRPLGSRGSWTRYVRESGHEIGEGGGDGGSGGDTTGATRGPGTRVLFNGEDLDDWTVRPSGVWSVNDGRLLGMTFEKDTEALCFYKQLVFTDYRLVFKVQRGTKAAKFVARMIPPGDAQKKPIAIDIKEEWLEDQEWTEMEFVAFDGVLTVLIDAKVVHKGAIHKERGFVGFAVGKDGAIGVKDVVWHRPK